MRNGVLGFPHGAIVGTPIVLLFALAVGCAAFQGEGRPKTHVLQSAATAEPTRTHVVTLPAQFRGAYVIETKDRKFLCAEPPPDVAQSIAASFAAKLKVPKDQGEVDASASRIATALELSGRSELTLLAREMLYRNCELAVNYGGLPPDKVLEHQGKIVDAIVTLAEADLKRATAEQDRARAELLRLAATKAQQVEMILRDLFSGSALDTDKVEKLKELIPDGEARTFLDSLDSGMSRNALRAQIATEKLEVVAAIADALGRL